MRITTTELVLGALATFRLTWLVSADEITKPIRRAIHRLGRPKVDTLITCQWCLSIWFGALVAVAAWALEGAWFTLPAAALSFSAVAGVLANSTKASATTANHDEPDVVVMAPGADVPDVAETDDDTAEPADAEGAGDADDVPSDVRRRAS